MASDQTKHVNEKVLQDDKDALAAIQAMTDYAPANSACAKTALAASLSALTTAENTAVQKKAESDAARDAECAAEWAFHNLMLAAKDQVVAQYGPDSDEVQAVGLKKKSERKHPSSKKTTPPAP